METTQTFSATSMKRSLRNVNTFYPISSQDHKTIESYLRTTLLPQCNPYPIRYIDPQIPHTWTVEMDLRLVGYIDDIAVTIIPFPKYSEEFVVDLHMDKPVVFTKDLFYNFSPIFEYIWPNLEWIFNLRQLVKHDMVHIRRYSKNAGEDPNLSVIDVKELRRRVQILVQKAKRCEFEFPLLTGRVCSHCYYPPEAKYEKPNWRNALHKNPLSLSPIWFTSGNKRDGTRKIEITYRLRFYNCILNLGINHNATPCEYLDFVSKIRINKRGSLFAFLTYYTIRLDVTTKSDFHKLSPDIKKFLLYTTYRLDPEKFSVLTNFSPVILDLIGHDNVVRNLCLSNYKFGKFLIIPGSQFLRILFALSLDYYLVCGNSRYFHLTGWCKKLLKRLHKISPTDYVLRKEKFIINTGILNKEQFLNRVSSLVQRDKPVGEYDLACLKDWRLKLAKRTNVTTRRHLALPKNDRYRQCEKAILKGIKVLQTIVLIVCY